MKKNKTDKGARKCWRRVILSRAVRKISLKTEKTLNKDLKIELTEQALAEGRAFQAEGAASMKTLRTGTSSVCKEKRNGHCCRAE